MSDKLDKFLEYISCENTIYQNYNRANDALNTFRFDKVIIHPRCKHTADEFRLYKYKTNQHTGDIIRIPEDKNNHCIDALRYAIESVKKQRPDVVVLDIKLSDMEGLEVLNEIKSFDKTIPVIINSAYSVYKSDFTSWMADDYIVKSSDISGLLEKIRELLGGL